MARDWEAEFRRWARPSSASEREKMRNAERLIREAIRESLDQFDGHAVEVFAQGSYRNNTNVRQESDVDICVCCTDTFFSDFTEARGLTRRDARVVRSHYKYADFHAAVQAALVAKFGRAGVSKGKKAFDIHATSYRVDADVLPAFQHRRYLSRDDSGNCRYWAGVQFKADDGGSVINWPRQHYDNGVAKNERTRMRFKRMVRVLKNLRLEMAEMGVRAATDVASFLLECLAWNVPDERFGLLR